MRHVGQRLKPGATLIVKNGAQGRDRLSERHVASGRRNRVGVFDTIGAGDSFNTGYLRSATERTRSARRARSRLPGGGVDHFAISAPLDRAGELAEQIDLPRLRVAQ